MSQRISHVCALYVAVSVLFGYVAFGLRVIYESERRNEALNKPHVKINPPLWVTAAVNPNGSFFQSDQFADYKYVDLNYIVDLVTPVFQVLSLSFSFFNFKREPSLVELPIGVSKLEAARKNQSVESFDKFSNWYFSECAGFSRTWDN